MKQITKKKPIDLESEFIGIPVGQKKERPKKNDLTKDLQLFLKVPISIESIRDVLLRIEGRYCCEKPGIVLIKIFSIKNLEDEREFIIKIKHAKFFQKTFLLSTRNLYELHNFGDGASDWLSTSILKRKVSIAIQDWLIENLDQTTLVE